MEVLLEHAKTKDHLNFTQGEVARVLLLHHPKLPADKYLIEKEDGTSKCGRVCVVCKECVFEECCG